MSRNYCVKWRVNKLKRNKLMWTKKEKEIDEWMKGAAFCGIFLRRVSTLFIRGNTIIDASDGQSIAESFKWETEERDGAEDGEVE